MKTFKELRGLTEKELEIEPDPFGNSRRAKRKAILRAKGELARKHDGKVTISNPGFGIAPNDKPKVDPGFGIAPKGKPKYTPKAPPTLKKSDGVTITRPRNLGTNW